MISVFTPAGVPAKEIEEIFLTIDEFEAHRYVVRPRMM